MFKHPVIKVNIVGAAMEPEGMNAEGAARPKWKKVKVIRKIQKFI